MVDNINKNTITEKLARKNLNALNELKNAEIKNKCRSSNSTELLKLFDDLLETISNNNNNNNNSNNNGNNNENESESENDNDSESESEDKNEECYKIKQLNGYFRMIDETKSFEKQINVFKKKEFFRGILAHCIL